MTASFPLNRKHYPKLMLDTSLIIKALSLEDVKVPVTVYIEGNIAAGKTEFLKHFLEKKNIIILPEPLDQWTNFNGQNLLKMKYEDAAKYEYLFQTLANATKLNLLNEHCHKNGIKIIERSLQSGFNVFVKNSKENYGMDDVTYEALKYNYETMCTKNCLDMITCPDLYIYLQTSPRICYERMRKRNRNEEKNVDLKYLENLHTKYEEWLNRQDSEENAMCPILILNGNLDKELMNDLIDRAITTILNIAKEKEVLKHLFLNFSTFFNQ
jgi:deoxyadenosine/deoxycytidine kinase